MKFKLFLEFDYKKEHGHEKVETGSVEWHFHNYEHGYKHCTGGEKNPFSVEHKGKNHTIDKEYARGHGSNYEPQWFKFTKKLGEVWDLLSGVKIDTEKVPGGFK